MIRLLRLFGWGVGVLLAAQTVYAQKSTERYIPIGKSPGLSGMYTVIGTIENVNDADHTITMVNDKGTYRVKLTDRTLIWLDRSGIKQTNLRGSMADCKNGRMAEVKYVKNEMKEYGEVEWMKIEVK